MSRVLRIAIAGCGTVGGSLLDLLARHGPAIARRSGVNIEVARVLVRDVHRPRSVAVNRALITDDVHEFLSTPADVIVEAIGGVTDAGHIARTALGRGRRLVTANKALMREAGPALAAMACAQRQAGATLDFEAAVGGGVPIVRLLRESLAGHGLQSVRGVLNGTTNYILTRLEQGASHDEALAAARTAGFAEADPSRDLTGHDAADKIALLAWLAFGTDPASLTVRVRGLPVYIEYDVRDAMRQGKVIRLIATATRVADGVFASVAPRLLAHTDPLAQTRDEENLIQLESESSGVVTVSGRGAGGAATASALLADLLCAASPIPTDATPVRPAPNHLTEHR